MPASNILSLSSFTLSLGLALCAPALALADAPASPELLELLGDYGDSPESLAKECENEDGKCVTWIQGQQHGDKYVGTLAGCICASGQVWSTGDIPIDPISFDVERIPEICRAELRHCNPEARPGPSDIELVDLDNLKTRHVVCLIDFDPEAKNADQTKCSLQNHGTSVDVWCSHPTQGDSSSSFEVEGWQTRAQLYDRCVDIANALDPKPEKPKDGSIEDILDKLGCDISPSSSPAGWRLSFLGLLALGLLRSRRQTR